jgi:tetratricopeptide (TPR) repeat protein
VGGVLVLLVLGGIGLAVWYAAARRQQEEGPDDSGSHHWQQAQQAAADYDFALAREHLGQCLETWPFSASVHFLMARTCRRADDTTGWRAHLERARLLHWSPQQLELEERLQEAQFGDVWVVEGWLLNDLSASPPEDILIREALIKGYLENDRPHDALNMADTWLEQHPDDWEARLYHGRAYQWGAIFDRAIADYEKVLAVKPDQPEAHLWIADAILSTQQYEQAMEHYRVYLRGHPDNIDALTGLARCQYQLGQSNAAQATLDELLRHDPKHVGSLLLRAKLVQAESPEKALVWLRQAHDLAPDHTEVLHNLILALRQLDRKEEADKYDRRLKDRKEKLNKLKQLKVDMLNDANDVSLRYRAAVLALEVGQDEEAAHLFQTVLWIDPEHRPTLRAMADYFQKHGDARRAAYARARAEGKQPGKKPTP